MGRVYATAAEYQSYTGQAPDTDTDRLLARASEFLDSQVLYACWYAVDTDGYPTDTTVAAAFRTAVCAQVEWWGELGDSTGATGAGWSTVKIGTAQLSRSGNAAADGSDSPARQVAPNAWVALRSPDLALVFRLGAVGSWW